MYDDYLGFDERYFNRGAVADGYVLGYYEYPPRRPIDYSAFASQVANVTGQSKVLVVGCATGISLRWMRVNQDIDRSFGMDISEWAIDNALSDVRDQVYLGDARDQDRYEEIARDAQGPPRWDGIYTEFLLSHFTDSEAINVCDICHEEATDVVVHRIWSGTGRQRDRDHFNIKTVSEWISLTGYDESDNVFWIDYDRPEDSTI